MKARVLINNGTMYAFINVADIIWFEARDRKISVLYRNGNKEERIEFSDSLVNIASKLGGSTFVQIHRSYLISMDYLESVQNGIVKMSDENKTQIPIGRTYMAGLMEKVITSTTFI